MREEEERQWGTEMHRTTLVSDQTLTTATLAAGTDNTSIDCRACRNPFSVFDAPDLSPEVRSFLESGDPVSSLLGQSVVRGT